MSTPSPARYRTTNWSSYTASLCKRGSLLIWLDKEMTWLAPPGGSPGRPAVFSDAAIQFCLTIEVLFKLPLRQTTGMVASLLKMADLGLGGSRLHHPVPTADRGRTVAPVAPRKPAEGWPSRSRMRAAGSGTTPAAAVYGCRLNLRRATRRKRWSRPALTSFG